jgi:hypothetical protein
MRSAYRCESKSCSCKSGWTGVRSEGYEFMKSVGVTHGTLEAQINKRI